MERNMIELFRFIILSVRFFFLFYPKNPQKKRLLISRPLIWNPLPILYIVYIYIERIPHPLYTLLEFTQVWIWLGWSKGYKKKCFCAIDNECARLNSSSWTSKDTFFSSYFSNVKKHFIWCLEVQCRGYLSHFLPKCVDETLFLSSLFGY